MFMLAVLVTGGKFETAKLSLKKKRDLVRGQSNVYLDREFDAIVLIELLEKRLLSGPQTEILKLCCLCNGGYLFAF